ncbi:MAG: MATE family efflux transporter [Oscillospiraceae bacterium]
MQFELRSKAFYQKTLRLMAPVVLQQLITVGVNFMDNLMIGGFGETQIAAASFGNQFYTLFQFICMGLGSGAVVLSSQFWGRKELEPMRKVAAIALQLTLALCALFTLVSVAFPQAILRFFTHEAAVVSVGAPYMRLIGLTFLLAGLSSTATYLLRSVGNVRVPLIGSAGAFVLNIFFNWVFIFGKLGAPRLELVGAAVGTIIARVFEFCFVFGYFVWKDDRFRFRLKHFFLPGGDLWRPYFKFGLPVLISDTLLGVSLTLTSVIMGHVGEAASAASAIIMSMVKMTDILNSAMGGASAIVIGNTIGEGDIPRAKREGNTYMLLSVLLGLIIIVPLYLLGAPYLSAYNIADETRAMAEGMLLYNCLTMPLQTNAYVSSKGILRGGGDTRFLLVADSALVWIFSLPVGALAGLVWHVNPVWVYVIIRVQYPLKGIVCFIRYATGKWIKVISAKKE